MCFFSIVCETDDTWAAALNLLHIPFRRFLIRHCGFRMTA